MNIEHVTLYNKRADGGTVQSSFGFERSALKAARELGLTQFVIAIKGRILHAEGVTNAQAFING